MMPRCRAWLTCCFTHPASVSAIWVRVITLLRVTRDPAVGAMLAPVSNRDSPVAAAMRRTTARPRGRRVPDSAAINGQPRLTSQPAMVSVRFILNSP